MHMRHQLLALLPHAGRVRPPYDQVAEMAQDPLLDGGAALLHRRCCHDDLLQVEGSQPTCPAVLEGGEEAVEGDWLILAMEGEVLEARGGGEEGGDHRGVPLAGDGEPGLFLLLLLSWRGCGDGGDPMWWYEAEVCGEGEKEQKERGGGLSTE